MGLFSSLFSGFSAGGSVEGTEVLAMVSMDIYASSREFNVELQRATGFTGTFETIAIIRGFQFSILKKKFTYIDTDGLNNSGAFRYRMRHIRADANPSAWTTPVLAAPTMIETETEFNSISFGSEEGLNEEGTSELSWATYSPFGGDEEIFE